MDRLVVAATTPMANELQLQDQLAWSADEYELLYIDAIPEPWTI
jgi:hypothetical protein